MASVPGGLAIVTGAASPNGIGRATAFKLVEDGLAVIVTDIAGSLRVDGADRDRLDLLSDLAAEITGAGGQAFAMEVDVTDRSHILRCVERAKDLAGPPTALVNNAGTTVGTGPFLDATEADWTASYRVNLLGPALFCQAVIPEFKANGGGAIVNVGSTGSLGAEAGFGAYTAMKHGLIGLTKTIAAEFGRDAIRCNAICPGYTATDMHMAVNWRLAEEQNASINEVMSMRYANVALGRAGSPREVAEAIGFLLSPAASYITGVALAVAGGTSPGL